MEFRVLGPFRVTDGEREIPLPRQKHRALLAFLVLHAREVVSVDRLLDELWGERPPATAKNSLQNNVSQLRKLLGADVLHTRPPGYVLDLAPDDVDLSRFLHLLEDARTQAPPERAATLRRALALWRGPALADLEFEPFALGEAQRLEELRVTAEEELVAAELELGRHAELVPRIEELVARHPLRERLRGQLMVALYRSGRQVEALAAFKEARRTLVEELGIEPGQALRALEQGILRQEPGLSEPGAAVAQPALRPADLRERRATVTVLFAEVAAPGDQDAERYRVATTRAFHELRAATEYHGGTVERLAGDELMAVFGVPERHEDDGLRAVRAALQIRRAMRSSAELEVRVALETGEVVAPGPAVRTPVAGTPVTQAKRLAEAAPAGEVVAGAATLELLQGVVHAETLGPLAVRGRVEPVQVFRIDGVRESGRRLRTVRTPLVGRGQELDSLHAAFAEVCANRRTTVLTVLGDAGVGKTRLAVELAAALENDARVAVGRCVSYGEGATWLPLRELVQHATRQEELATLLGDERAAVVLGGLLGGGTVSVTDAFWAARRFVESLARERPALVVLEDLHWAGPTFIDFVEQLANSPADAPALVLCLARPELVHERPGLASFALQPLSDAQAKELVDSAADESVPARARARIAELAEGNPLFAEQLLAYAREHGIDAIASVPPTVEALLASRLDRLDAEERSVLQRAAVVGREFWHASVLDLTPTLEVPGVGRHLAELERKGLIRPTRSSSERDDAFSFQHVLIRDVAYGSIPKRDRADLHEGVAEWLDARGDADDEIIGYHLEQAYLLHAELAPVDRHARRLAEDAGERLAGAGIRAWKRADAAATTNLLRRATALLPSSNPRRTELLCELGLALWTAGATDDAKGVLKDARASANATGDRRIALRAEVELCGTRLFADPEGRSRELIDLAANSIPVFEEFADDRAIGRTWLLLAYVHGGLHCRNAAWEEAAGHALAHYRRSGWPVSGCLREIAAAVFHGPTPVRQAITRCRSLQADVDRSGEANLLVMLGGLEAMRGRFAAGRRLVDQARQSYEELGQKLGLAANALWMAGEIALLESDFGAAERLFHDSCVMLEEMGERAHLSTYASELAEALWAQGRDEEALRWTELAEQHAASDDISAQFAWRSVRAKVLARRGALKKAVAFSDQAVELVSSTDAVNQHARVLLDRAEILQLADRYSDAAASAERALQLFEVKGNVVAARRVRALLNELAVA